MLANLGHVAKYNQPQSKFPSYHISELNFIKGVGHDYSDIDGSI